MIGVDIVRIDRFNQVSQHFLERVFSQEEIEEYKNRDESMKASYLASRFAAKEAYVKASGKTEIDFSKISILNDLSGRPHLYINGKEEGEVSLAHDEFAIAYVVL